MSQISWQRTIALGARRHAGNGLITPSDDLQALLGEEAWRTNWGSWLHAAVRPWLFDPYSTYARAGYLSYWICWHAERGLNPCFRC